MGNKPTFAGVETRIHDAMRKADADGYAREQMRWYVTDQSYVEFSCCAQFWVMDYDKAIHLNPQLVDPMWLGIIGNVKVYRDFKLNGKIAELRPIEGGDYAITLDFTTEVLE